MVSLVARKLPLHDSRKLPNVCKSEDVSVVLPSIYP